MPVVESNGIRVHVDVRGEGAPILFIPGLGLKASECKGITGLLADGHRVICVDNRGAGLTDKPEGPYSMAMMADDAKGVLDAMGVPRAHVVGVSMGGKIAITLALNHPERVASLVLASTQPTPPTMDQRRRTRSLTALFGFFGTDRQARFGRERQREASAAFDAHADLGRILAPTLIVHARGDRIASFGMAKEMQRLIAASTFVGVEGGHAFFLMRPALLAGPTLDFLASLPA